MLLYLVLQGFHSCSEEMAPLFLTGSDHCNRDITRVNATWVESIRRPAQKEVVIVRRAVLALIIPPEIYDLGLSFSLFLTFFFLDYQLSRPYKLPNRSFLSSVGAAEPSPWATGVTGWIVCVLVTQSCPTLCDPMDCSPPGSSAHGAFQEILEWVAIPSPGESSRPRDWTWVSCIEGRFFTIWGSR